MNTLDLHTHTLASGHAYSTLNENIRSAAAKGLKVLGVSDHAPKMPGSTHPYYFSNLRVLPEVIEGVRVLKGVELNILDAEGSIDLDAYTLDFLDYAIISLHPPCFEDLGKEGNTQAIIRAMAHPKVKILGHPDDSRYALDYEAIVEAAKAHDVWIEINDSSLRPTSFRENAHDNYKALLAVCKARGQSIIINSDAHYSAHIGRYEAALELIESVDFPLSLVVNFNNGFKL
ncbi:phosphatase [Fusibacter sp. JL298sf-3]